jgi:hypothetical protein
LAEREAEGTEGLEGPEGAERAEGAEGAQCQFSVSAKECVTAMATIDTAGQKLNLWLPANTKMRLCEQWYRNGAIEEDIAFDHSENGRTDRDLEEQHLRWLRQQLPATGRIGLIWNIFGVQRDEEVKNWPETQY